MTKVCLLSGEHLKLAKSEVLALAKTDEYELFDRVMIVDTENKLYHRLAYTHNIYEHLFNCKPEELEDYISDFDWNSVYEKDYCARIINLTGSELQNSEKDLGSIIWRKLKNPKVRLKFTATPIYFIFTADQVICGILKHDIKKDFLQRKAHMRPVMQPVSLDPRLARACVNLTGIKPGQILLDPFCGVGGILIEAGKLGCWTQGYDISDFMLESCKKNLEFYGIKKYKLKNKDATKIDDIHFVVTDVPYGLNSQKTEELDKLYKDFMSNLRKHMTKKAVVIFPAFAETKKLLKDFTVEGDFEIYLHKSLSKKIYLIS